jgi:hypothetical protein
MIFERQPGEPARWFRRFTEHYLVIQEGRSLDNAYKRFRESQGITKGPLTVPSDWIAAFAKWNWRKRANAWDVYQADMIREASAAKALDEHNRLRLLAQERLNRIAQVGENIDHADVTDPVQYEKRIGRAIELERRVILTAISDFDKLQRPDAGQGQEIDSDYDQTLKEVAAIHAAWIDLEQNADVAKSENMPMPREESSTSKAG